MPHFEALLVPVDHVQFLLKPLYVPIDIWNLEAWSSHYYTRGQNKPTLSLGRWLNETVVPVESISERLVYVSRQNLGVYQVVKRRQAALQEMKLWEGYQVHSYFVHIYIQVALESHRTCHVVDHIGDYRVLLLEVVLLFLVVPGLNYRGTILNLVAHVLAPKRVLSLLQFFILLINFWNDVKESLVVYWQDTVGIIDENVESKHRVIRRSYDIIVFRWENTCWKFKCWGVKISQVSQNVRA